MFTSIPSLDPVLQCLLPAFTLPSFQTHIEVLLGWAMCLGKRTEFGVFQAIQADTPISRKERHPFDRFYNFFSRAAWTVHDLARQLALAIVVALNRATCCIWSLTIPCCTSAASTSTVWAGSAMP